MNVCKITVVAVLSSVILAAQAFAQSANEEDLAKQLANPVAALISVPPQFNYDTDIGPGDEGHRYVLNIQPVVPVSHNSDWNLISRTIVPLISQDDIFPGAGSQTGLGDVVQILLIIN